MEIIGPIRDSDTLSLFSIDTNYSFVKIIWQKLESPKRQVLAIIVTYKNKIEI
jgi:hypothetical protein